MKQWIAAAKVIRRQGRKGCVTPPQRACRAMRRKAGDMFERSESLTAQALATNSERQATKRLKDVLVTPEQSKWRPARRQPKFFEYFFTKKYKQTLPLKQEKLTGHREIKAHIYSSIAAKKHRPSTFGVDPIVICNTGKFWKKTLPDTQKQHITTTQRPF